MTSTISFKGFGGLCYVGMFGPRIMVCAVTRRPGQEACPYHHRISTYKFHYPALSHTEVLKLWISFGQFKHLFWRENICNYNTKDTCCKCGRISYSLRTGTGSANVGISLRQLSPVLHELPWQASTATYVSSVSGQTVSNNSYQFLKRNLLA